MTPELRLNLVVLRCADLDRAARFYEALGVTFERHRHGNGPEHLAGELAGGCIFELYPQGKAGSTIGTRVGFAVPTVDTLSDLLVAAGGTLVSSPADSPWGRRAVVADPDGHRAELTEATKPC